MCSLDGVVCIERLAVFARVFSVNARWTIAQNAVVRRMEVTMWGVSVWFTWNIDYLSLE